MIVHTQKRVRTYVGGSKSRRPFKWWYAKQKNTPTSSKARKGKSHNGVVN